MRKGDSNDPLLRQVLPLQSETRHWPGYSLDPVGDLAATAQTGVIKKYRGRALLIATGVCAVHCRYCFRRNFPYQDQQLAGDKLQQALTFLADHPDINEAILSGGDPLLLSDRKIAALLEGLDKISHIRRLRIHSRLPVVLPQRITPLLLKILNATNKSVVVVMHSNHRNELSNAVEESCRQMRLAGITLLNQSVLLKNVNDNADSLCDLSEALFEIGVLPYYLHSLDKAAGTGHFEVGESEAKAINREMKRRLPGYLVPRLVKEQAGAEYKLNLL